MKMGFFTEVGRNNSDFKLSPDTKHFGCGKEAISALLKKLGLTYMDEVYINSTFETKYVSSCVTSTVFNFCKPSKVITDNTKLIFIIHEFGFPNESVFELKKFADENKIMLVEDCAQSAFSFFQNNERVGTVGDYSIYSLKKILPYNNAGILLEKGQTFPYLNDLEKAAQTRRTNYKRITDIFERFSCAKPINISDKISPYVFAFNITNECSNTKNILKNLLDFDLIFWTNINLYSLPTHQMLPDEYFNLLDKIINHE